MVYQITELKRQNKAYYDKFQKYDQTDKALKSILIWEVEK